MTNNKEAQKHFSTELFTAIKHMNKLQFTDISERHLGRAIRMQAEQNGDTPFLIFEDTRYSFYETNEKVNQLSAGLAKHGIGKGDRIVFYMGSAPEIMFLVLAANKLGAVWIPVNTDYKGYWLEDTINRSRPKLLVTDSEYAPRVQEVQAALAVSTIAVLTESSNADIYGVDQAIDFQSLYANTAPEPDLSGFDYGDTCAVLWTSGTTGRSKGVMQSHNVWMNAVFAGDDLYSTQSGDVIFNVLPMYNSGAWVTSLFRALLTGVSLAVDPGFSVSNFWQRVDYYQATQAFTIGAMHIFLLNAPETSSDSKNTLREVQAVPMPPHCAESFANRFDVKLLGQGLSQSEAMLIIRQDHQLRQSWPVGSCGNPVANIEVMITDNDGAKTPVGEHGELWVKEIEPHTIFNGYLDDKEATQNAYSGDWYKTGDLVKKDHDENYFFVDRKKDAVRYKGRNISTFEVELVARKHPNIMDCAAFGIQAEELEYESEIKIDVVLKPNTQLTALALAEFINENAPYFFVPRYIEFVDQLPYTPNNKIQKYKLREKGLTAKTWDANAEGFKAIR